MNQQNFTQSAGYNHIIFFPLDHLKQEQPWPTIVFLHGAGERGNDLKLVTSQGLPRMLKDRDDFPFITVAPQCPEDEYWIPSMVDELILMVADKFRVDTDRLYLTGISMGGYATWVTAIDFPDRFAAIAPICGGGDPDKVSVIKHLPAWSFHGAKDPVVKVTESEEMVKALKKAGGNVRFTLYPEGGHDVWTETYNNPSLYDWFLSQSRKNQAFGSKAS